jgi:pimeloyl-ACP methyl ester carboxylesterase
MRIIRSLSHLFLIALLVACNRASPIPEPHPGLPAKSEKSGYIRRANNDTVIVFVHGIFGGPQSTWSNSGTHNYWPELLTNDDAFSDTDIFVLGYDSPYLSGSLLLDDLIENARLRLDNAEIFKHKHVVFICHSMGGLIVRGLLSRYEDQRKKVQLVYLLSTPTEGSHIANIAKLLSRNPQLRVLGTIPKDSDSILRSQQSDWRALHNRPLSKCAFEERDTYGIRVVDQSSASALCDGPLDPINDDHIGIAKPADDQADVYVGFRQAFMNRPSEQMNANVSLVEGHVDTLRKVEVDCGETKQSAEVEIEPPIKLSPGQAVTQTLASLQQASNLKSAEVLNIGRKGQKAALSYVMVGLDKATDMTCASKGIGIILVAFFLTQPRSMTFPSGFQVVSSSDQTIALLSRPGTVHVENAERIEPIDTPFSPDKWELVYKFSKKTGNYTLVMNVNRADDWKESF